MEKIVALLEELVAIPSPTGMTTDAELWLLQQAQERGINARRCHKGTVIYEFKTSMPSDHQPLILAAHIDTLGAMVKQVSESGLDIVPVGSYPALYIMGNSCTIHGAVGKYRGTILPRNPAVHVNADLRKLTPDYDNIYIRTDVTPNTELKEIVSVGDFISLDPGFRYTNGYINSRHLDDKASAAILLDISSDIQKMINDAKLKRDVFIVFNGTEETGQGITSLPEQADLLVVDMGVVGDNCQGNEHAVSICAKDSSGPYHHDFTRELATLSKHWEIDAITDIFPFYQSDGSAALRAGKDYRVALIGPGVSASHGWERTHIDALMHTKNLILALLKS